MNLPRLYAIADLDLLGGTEQVGAFTRELIAASVTLIQLRSKNASTRAMLSAAREMKRVVALAANAGDIKLIMNDRADLCLAAEFHGVHVGQDDLSAEGARRVVGAGRIVGVSTHNADQLKAATASSADYVAIGPVYATGSKQNPDPVIGLEGVRAARALTQKPLVAIGGITAENCCDVISAGADSVAVIGAISRNPGKSAALFLQHLR